jgi:hypothetical protein
LLVDVDGSGRMWLRHVTSLEGRVRDARGDTLVLVLTGIRSGLRHRRGVVAVVPQVGRPAGVRHFDVLKTATGFLASGAVMLLIIWPRLGTG